VAGEKAVTTLVTGRVLLPNGSPAAGIEVHLGWYWECIPPVEVPLSSQSLPYRRRRVSFLTPVKADDEGKFAFGRDPADTGEIPPSVSKDLRITASRGELLASVRAPSRLSLPIKMPDFRLEEGLRVRGRVVTEAGGPVPGVEVRLRAKREPDELRLLCCVSNDEGRFSLGPIRRRGDWDLSLRLDHPNFPWTMMDLEAADVVAGQPITAVLPTGCTLRGAVLSVQGTLRSGVQVVATRLVGDDWKPLFSRTGTTDEKGRFELTGITAGTLRLLLYVDLEHPAGSKGARDAVPWVFDSIKALPGEVIDVDPLLLELPGAISVVVRDPAGNLITDAEVTAVNPVEGETTTYTDEDGAFRLGDLPPGRYVIRARSERIDADPVEVQVHPGRETEVEVVILR